MLKVITLVVLVALLACISGCGSPEVPGNGVPEGYVEIDCTECNGVGSLTYGPDHPAVQQGLSKPGTFTCPMCNGDKKLLIWAE